MRRLWKKIKYKLIYALRGLWITVTEEKSLWIHIIIMSIVIGFGFYFKLSIIKWVLIILTFSIVLAFEVLNTAIEALVDMIAFEYNLKIKKIKDISAGATLVVSFFSIIIGLLIFVPIIIKWFT